jgi:hypothetical protein
MPLIFLVCLKEAKPPCAGFKKLKERRLKSDFVMRALEVQYETENAYWFHMPFKVYLNPC